MRIGSGDWAGEILARTLLIRSSVGGGLAFYQKDPIVSVYCRVTRSIYFSVLFLLL